MNTLFKTVTNSQKAEGKIVSIAPHPDNSQKIQINNLELMMFIGVTQSEHEAKQRVIVSVDADVTFNPKWREDSISDVVSYMDIIDDIKAMIEQGHIKLVERFAEMITEICFTYDAVQAVSVKVEKPDIIDDAQSVGVSITRHRD